MTRLLLIALVLSIVGLAAPAWADFEAGIDAYNRKDYTTALREWRPQAEQGNAHAQFTLGFLYETGRGVSQDHEKARHWYEKAAAQGDALAQVNLGNYYLNGIGLPQDYKMALHWISLAASQGQDIAQTKLGTMYAEGMGVPQNFVRAHMWYNLSGSNGNETAVRLRDVYAAQMTPAQIAEAQKLAREWKPIKNK